MKLEVAGSILWCNTYKKTSLGLPWGWGWGGKRGDENKQSAFAGAASPYEVWSGLPLDASYLE